MSNHKAAMSCQIWSRCIEKNIWLSVEYLPGVEADYSSRNFINENVKWMLDKDIFKEITQHWSMNSSICLPAD